MSEYDDNQSGWQPHIDCTVQRIPVRRREHVKEMNDLNSDESDMYTSKTMKPGD